MSAGLFIAGALVTLIVVIAMGVLVWGLRLEARANQRDSARRPSPDRSRGSLEVDRRG